MQRRHSLRLILVALAALLLSAGWATGQQDRRTAERIVDFQVEIWIDADGSMTVEERIEVVSAGAEIKRGIFRDFPTQYRGPLGMVERRGFALDRVSRDGLAEPYHTEPTSDGIRVYIGAANVFLEPGRYVYRLVYRTDRQLGHFGDFDELYWNVTGNGWAFVIEHAAVRIHLPAGA
ncbi:MAG: DUF2207 domain-containing protein, partial [Alphaproteobacteria bacterium]|nr:DUF2207 domain-containing protein [Alphaproteobacteria bacterium]